MGLFCYPPFYTAAAHRKSSCPRLSGAQKLDKISEIPVFSRLSDFVPNNNIIVDAAHDPSCFHSRFLPYLSRRSGTKFSSTALENMDSIRRYWEGIQFSGWFCLPAGLYHETFYVHQVQVALTGAPSGELAFGAQKILRQMLLIFSMSKRGTVSRIACIRKLSFSCGV